MEKKGRQTGIIVALLVVVVAMSIGFAATAYNSTLNINGGAGSSKTTTIKKAAWSVHFDDESLVETGVTNAATSPTLTATTFSYNVTLSKPGQSYEADFNVVNDGTFDAKLSKVTLSDDFTLSDAEKKYLSITFSVDGTTYTSTADTNVALNAEGTHAVVVKVEYLTPSDSADLPEEDVEKNLTAVLDYVQADES